MTIAHLQPGRGRPGAFRRVALDALGDAAHRLQTILRTWRWRARERAHLASLDDRMLQDIGLTRADRSFLVNKPFWRE